MDVVNATEQCLKDITDTQCRHCNINQVTRDSLKASATVVSHLHTFATDSVPNFCEDFSTNSLSNTTYCYHVTN